MKKIFIFYLSLMGLYVCTAQDTVISPKLGNYYYNYFPSEKLGMNAGVIASTGSGCGIKAKRLYLKDKNPVTIYGMAACMVSRIDMTYVPPMSNAMERNAAYMELMEAVYSEYVDTSMNTSYEDIGVYLRDGDSLLAQREVRVHRKYDTPAYYFKEPQMIAWYGNPDFLFPMYEKYFDSSITVYDTFYVGTTMQTRWESLPYPIIDFSLVEFCGSGLEGMMEYHVRKYCQPRTPHWSWPPCGERSYYLLFPILTPDPNAPEDPGDTPGDTTGVSQADMVGRYVTVQPNPATEEARVLSSFGLQRIEAYTGDGRCILSQKADGLHAVLDVRGWASGTYLLRVTTPMGTTTKKLLVR